MKRSELHASATVSHKDRIVLSPEIGTVSGENLQLCSLLSLTSASPQGHAALMWAKSPLCLCPRVTGARVSEPFLYVAVFEVSRFGSKVCKSQTRMAAHEGLMAASETERGQVSSSSVSVIYDTVPQRGGEKYCSPKA